MVDQEINSKLDKMLRKQSANFKAFKRTVSFINVESISDKWEFEDALKSLQARWSAIRLLHWEIDSEIDDENEQYENTFIEHEKQFNELKETINIKMWSVNHRENSTPKMDIPYFNESSRRKQDYQKTSDVPTFKKQQYNKPNFNNNFHQNGKDRSYANNFASKTYQGSQNCPLCKDSHRLFHCKTFLEYMPDMKRNIVNQFNLCKNCLHDHKGKICISEKRCRNCQGDHNTLLHDAFKSAPTDVNNGASTAASYDQSHRNNVTHVSNETITETLLATAQIKVLGANGTYHIMRALIDQGSQTSLISENAAQKLGLPRLPCKGSIYGIGTKEANCKGILKVIASAIYDDFTFHTDVLIMNCLTNNLPNQTFMKPSWPHLANLKLADPDFNISRPIDMLLGADVYSLIIMGGIIKQNNTVPVAQQTRLGWILCGNVQSFQCNVSTKAAPVLAMVTLKNLADEERSKYPEAAKVLEEDFYMGNLFSGSYSLPKTQSFTNIMPAETWRYVKSADNPADCASRGLTVKTKNGMIKRSITKLSLLPVTEQQPCIANNKDQNNITIPQNMPISNTSTSKPKAFYYVSLVLTLLMLIITPVRCDYKLSSFNDNQSIYFDKISNMRLERDDWKLVVFYDMSPYWQGTKLLNKYMDHLQNICVKSNQMSHCNIILVQLRHSLDELDHYNNILLGQQFTAGTRHKRGLINGIGNVAHALFGVLDEDFAEKYQKDIEIIRNNEKHLAQLWIKSNFGETESELTNQFSYHDVHHYVVSYALVGVVGTLGALHAWRRLRGYTPPRSRTQQQQSLHISPRTCNRSSL